MNSYKQNGCISLPDLHTDLLDFPLWWVQNKSRDYLDVTIAVAQFGKKADANSDKGRLKKHLGKEEVSVFLQQGVSENHVSHQKEGD